MQEPMGAGGSDPSGDAGPVRDPLRELERVALRRAWLSSGVFFALVGVTVAVGTVLAPPSVDQVPYFSLNIVVFFVLPPVAYLLALRWGIRRTIRRLLPLGPLIRDATAPLFGPVVELENALVLTLAGGTTTFTRFYDARGEPLRVGVHRAAEWMRPSRIRRVLLLRSARAATSEASELVALNNLLGASLSAATVAVPRSRVRVGTAPSLMVSLSCYALFSARNLDRIAANLSEVDRFLSTLRASYAGRGASL